MAKKLTKNGPGSTGNEKKQTFTFASPIAKGVELVGDFTQWQQKPIRMEKSADGVWRTTVTLLAGPHYYRLLVDGQWHDDPRCTLHVPNPFGSQDCVCQVS